MKLESPENGMQKLPTLKGEELYHALEDFFDRERPSYGAELASRALGEIGFVGIKYPAGMIHGGAKEGDYNYVVFDENNAQIVDHTKFAQGKGVVYGYTDGKQIVLNQEHLNPNTPIHEYQHLWRTAAKNMNPELIEHGDKLIMQTQLFADLKEDPNYNHLTDEQICDEAFARLTGEDGAAILEQMAKDAIKENPLDTAKELSVINKLKEWLKKFWYWTLDTFTKWKPEDIKKMTLEDIRNLVLRDLANGVDPRTKLHEAENADDIKFMGSTTKKRMKDISTQLEGRELDEAQQAVADVYSGKKDNVSLTVEREDGSNKIIMRQGNDNHAGTKHSVFRHYGVKANSLNVDDLLLIPTVLKEGERKVSDNGRVAYVYVDPTSQVKYTVVTEPKNNKEFFNDFYSNKKANPSETSRVVENSTNTPEGAHNNDGNAFMRAKVDNNSETAKENGGNLSVEDKIKAVSQQFGVDEADVAMYANAIKKGSTAEAARARANIKRHLLQANEDKISSFKELLKYTVPVNEALKENFGDVDAMIEERKQQMEAQRNAMEAARKRAEEEEAKRQKHLEELSLIPDDQLDKQYMDALAKGDDATAREMLDEAARRKGYDDTESSYQGVGAWKAPGNPGYESDKARRDDWESSGSDVNLEDMALGYTPQPDDYFSHPERYSQNTPHGLESVKAINAAIDAIKNGEKDVKVKVYRAVPTSVKESKLRNGDWVTPSKKYAEMHGTNRLEGKYRIIEDEVPATQLWWDGNDANEFGFDDGKEYKYKNAKNNRKLNDLVTYDDKGDVIPPSKRFNSRKSDVRFHRVTEVKSPIVEQKLQKHPDSLMKAGTYFSGGGLVEEGLKGIIDPVVAVEYDRKISGVYRNNFGQHIVTADVRDVDPKELVKHIDGEVEYFHASPVCKNYSQAKSNSGEVELDKETAKSTADFIDAVKPRVVTIENVKGYKDSEAMKIITNELDKNGYTWDSDVYNAADYGGYTSRERLIVRAVKDGELPEKPKKQPRKGGWLEAVEDILPTLTVKESGVAPWMDARLKADGIDWQKVEKPLYVMGSAYADGKIPHAYGDEILPTLRTKSGDVIIMPGGKVLRADGRVLARITGLGDDYKLPKTESLAHTIIGNGIPVQLTQGVIAPLLNKDDLSGRNVLARLGSSIFKNNWDADKQKQVSDRVVNTANKLGGAEATVYTSVDEVPDAYLSDVKNGATGWYDPTTHTVHVYLPNCADANEAERTVLHEKIGHEGMEVLLGGEDGVRKFANFVYRSVGKDVRGKIIDFANKYDPDWKNSDRMNVGTQEYIAHLAEEGPKTAEDFSLWTKIKHYLIKVLKKLGVRVPGLLNDKDLRYYLMKAGKALHVWDNMPKEKQEAMMKQASNAEIKDALSDGAGKGKPRQKKGESTIQYMKRVQEWRKWQNAREDKENPEPPMFYDIDKDEAGKKEWAQLNKDWRERHHLVGEEPTGMPIQMENEEDDAYMNRIHEYEKWQAAMKDQEDPLPDMFAFEKKKQEEVKRKYEDWLAKHDLLEQQQADLDLYEGKIYPAETNPKADALEQQVMQDLAEVTSTDVSKEGAAMTVKHAVIHRRKNMEEASADDAIYINDVKNRIEKMADSGVFDKLLSDYKGKKNRAEKLAETIPYIIEAPRRLRDMAHNLNATGVFDKGHIHIQPADVEDIQPYVTDLITETAKKHTEIKKGKEIEVYDDPKAVSEVASKMAQAINANHQGEEGFVPIDGSDILSEHVLPLVKLQIVPKGIDYKNLSPEMKAALDSIRDWYNYTYDWLRDNHTLREDTGYNADYVNHIWDKEKSDKQAYALYVENRQRTKSPNEKKRTISTLMEGISVGLVPKTTDITKMMAYYSRSNIEAWVNKTMLQELSGLNVIERNEDGEVVSTDPLLSSSAPFNLEQYKYFEIPGVGPVWVYNVSPKQVKVKNPITDNEKVIYSEASAGDRFGVVFDTYQSSPFWKTFDTLASSAKKLELGFSGFHAGALTEVYMVQNMVEFGPKKAMANFMKYIFADTAKNHELPCFANPEDFQEAASHLVKFGATNDYAAADVQNMFDNMRDAMMKVQEKLKDGNKISGTVAKASMPLKVATQMLSLINKGMDVALWDYLHDGLKLATYRMRADKTKERAKKKGWTEEELSRALDEDGQFVNDMFGGQHWDVLGASHRTLRYAGRVLLSPDWNASTTRHFLALTGYGSIWNEATFENFKQYYKRLKHKELIPEDEGRRSRQISALLCYGIGFMVFYEGIANGINAAFRAMDEEKERKKAEKIRKTNPSYKSMYELAYGDEGMKWYDYLMRGNSLGQQSKIFLGRYEDGTEMYVRHGKQFREVPEYLFNHKGELEFPGPMVQRMIGKANPMVRMTLDDINYLSDFQASHADQEIQRKYGKTIGLLYKDALYWAPFLIPSQENKEFKAVDFFFPSSKGFSSWKAQSYFKDFILSGDMEGVVMTYQSCQRNGIDPEAQIKAAIGSVKALESAEMSDGVTSLQEASKRFDAAKSITEKKKMRQKMKKFLSQSDYKAFTQKEALDMVQGYLNGDEDLKEMEKAESKYLLKAKAEDVTEDWRIQNVWNGTMETYQEYQRLKDVDKVKANAFKNSKTNKRLFAARKAISAAKRKMNKAKKQMDGTNDAAKLVEIRNTRKELLKTLNGME
jgi:site-specific DNA-cytosine methylase